MKTFRQISSGFGVAAGCNTVIRNLKLSLAAKSTAPRVILLCMTFFLNTYAVPGGKPEMTEDMRLRAEKDLFYFQVRYLPFSE